MTADLTQPDAGPEPGAAAGRVNLAEEARRGWIRALADALHTRAVFQLQQLVRHPDGGWCTAQEIADQARELRARIAAEIDNGSRKHHHLARALCWIPKLALVLDFALLLYFMAGITNVNWATPVSAALGFATVLASMVTALSFGFLAYTGHRMRTHKNHAGSVHLSDLDRFTQAVFGAALAVIAVLALLMFVRMRSEVLGALGESAGTTALVIPLSLATVSAAANYLVILVHAFDGSDQTARLHRLSAAARRPLARAHRMRERAARHSSR
ncbi:MAG TPA: hypothetical protein VE343_06335 [Streptosporangiaceae bacterium]|jgi:hypothetical protein|nr:hypothetical protein [Streptosporangiaceae bacterium]